jgi:uncharacterized protein with HEPN domain
MCGKASSGIGFSFMERHVQAYLYDIVTACRHITSFTAQMTLETYRSDIRTKAACERMFEIIGESLRRIMTDFPDVFSQIPDAAQMIAFRNIIAHGYDIIDDELVWSSITSEFPSLTHLCEQLLHDPQRS